MRRRILLLTLGLTTIVVLAFAIPLVPLIRSIIEQRNERAAVEQAQKVGLYLRDDAPDAAMLTAYLSELNARSTLDTRVVLPGGALLGARLPSSIASDPPGGEFLPRTGGLAGGPNSPGGPLGQRDAPQPVQGGGRLVDSIAPYESGLARIQVYLSPSAHIAGLGRWLLLLAAVSIGLLALAAVSAEVLTRRIVRPLTRTAGAAHELSRGDMDARAPTTGPREVAEVASALNHLAGRIDELISQERETVADLSHQLRTPLTALRLEAERLAPQDAERIGERVSVLERTLTNVIHAARRPQREGLAPAVDATAVVRQRLDFWQALADEQDREVRRELPSGPVLVRCAPEDLASAVDALLENVFAHTADGVAMAVRLAPDAGGAILQVSDEGPGFEPAAAVRGRSDRGSSGLGLDIARQAADASGGDMTIGSAPGPERRGAVITLRLGAPQAR